MALKLGADYAFNPNEEDFENKVRELTDGKGVALSLIHIYTENTIVDQEQLLQELENIRKQGYALNLAEFSDHTYCIAVPVFGTEDEKLVYCIGTVSYTHLDVYKRQRRSSWTLGVRTAISCSIWRV